MPFANTAEEGEKEKNALSKVTLIFYRNDETFADIEIIMRDIRLCRIVNRIT